ncbi:hypothetical protein Q4610_08080 [Sphingobium sp. HBC34]|uniref:Uncharacterized protein n=1 Tax=Sphingobium cyanobacteriorum TaxID=3063954 RepID=A0ABT8ZKM4_9SPHN|nr:hypothetical protein [Sphingobium sp. HBC34]MDO7835006.1 hypothetical protein [Sphingobium sp. HBC34]
MARYKLVAFSNAIEGRDDDYNRWYDQRHLPDLVAIPDIVSGERFVCVSGTEHRYMAIYEVETDDIEGVMAELSRRAGTDLMPISDALDHGSARLAFWKAL